MPNERKSRNWIVYLVIGIALVLYGAYYFSVRADKSSKSDSAAPKSQSAAPRVEIDSSNGLEGVDQDDSNCDPNYLPCVPNVSYDLDCGDITSKVQVVGTDRHRFDRDGDGYGCETN